MQDAISGTPEFSGADPTFQSDQTSSVTCSVHSNFSTFMNPALYASSTSNVDIQTSSEFKDADSGDDLCCAPLALSVPCSEFQLASLPGNNITEPISVLTGSIFHPYTASSIHTLSLKRSVHPFSSNEAKSQNLTLNEGRNVHGTSLAIGIYSNS